jgi:hypothetical protein
VGADSRMAHLTVRLGNSWSLRRPARRAAFSFDASGVCAVAS